jgi:hypothetical protein
MFAFLVTFLLLFSLAFLSTDLESYFSADELDKMGIQLRHE